MGEGQEGSSDSPSNDSRFKTEEDIAMTEDFQLRPAGARPSEAGATVKSNTLLAIGTGALVAGTLDLTQACVLFGWDIPRVIAAGLLGQGALQGGVGTYFLGVLLHISLSPRHLRRFIMLRAADWFSWWNILWCADYFMALRWKKS